MSRKLGFGAALLLAGGMAMALAQDTAKKEHVVLTPEDIKWVDAPASLPAGAKLAVLEGDPKAEGMFAMRLKAPAGYKLPPHWHPGYERVTVISGTFLLGFGEKFDESKMRKLGPGSFFSLPPQTPHFAMVSEECVIQLNSVGPWKLNYVHPEDDPSSKR